MSIPIHTGGAFNSGVWPDTRPHINDASVWKECTEVWENVSGVWEIVWERGDVLLTDRTISDFVANPADALASLTFLNNGRLNTHDGLISTEWIDATTISTVGALYDVRVASITSGSFTSEGAAVGAWIGIDTEPTWSRERVSIGITSVTAVFEIRDKATQALQDSASITLAGEVDSGV